MAVSSSFAIWHRQPILFVWMGRRNLPTRAAAMPKTSSSPQTSFGAALADQARIPRHAARGSLTPDAVNAAAVSPHFGRERRTVSVDWSENAQIWTKKAPL
jgi:hypothetical protein